MDCIWKFCPEGTHTALMHATNNLVSSFCTTNYMGKKLKKLSLAIEGLLTFDNHVQSVYKQYFHAKVVMFIQFLTSVWLWSKIQICNKSGYIQVQISVFQSTTAF